MGVIQLLTNSRGIALITTLLIMSALTTLSAAGAVTSGIALQITGSGILLDQRRARGLVLIPELALEVDVHLSQELPLDSEIPLVLGSVDLPRLSAHFRIGE